MEPERIDCRRCAHYHVTWDKRSPHGCRAMGFKSLTMPSLEVLTASGTPCQFFEKRVTSLAAGQGLTEDR